MNHCSSPILQAWILLLLALLGRSSSCSLWHSQGVWLLLGRLGLLLRCSLDCLVVAASGVGARLRFSGEGDRLRFSGEGDRLCLSSPSDRDVSLSLFARCARRVAPAATANSFIGDSVFTLDTGAGCSGPSGSRLTF